MHKSNFVLVVAGLAFLPACGPSPDAVEPDETENLGQSKQAFCFTTPTDTPPPANVVVSGWNNEVTSGTTGYGNGPCDGYVVRFDGPGNFSQGPRIFGRMGDELGETACKNTKITIWVWSKFQNLSWNFHASHTVNAQWWPTSTGGFCNQFPAYVNTGTANGVWRVVVKAQVRTEINGNPYSSQYNRPVRVAANEQ